MADFPYDCDGYGEVPGFDDEPNPWGDAYDPFVHDDMTPPKKTGNNNNGNY